LTELQPELTGLLPFVEMGLEGTVPHRKLKLLGLHGFRTNGAILRQQLSKWGPAVNDLFDVDCLDAPLPCSGKSAVEGLFEGPYYEWYRTNEDYTEFYHVDEKLFSYITDYMKLHGPYDGLIGFSQGAVLSGCLAALQEKGLALQDIPPIRSLVLLAPAQLRAQHLKHIYEGPTIKCPTLAFLGEKDWLRFAGAEVLQSFENNVTIRHRSGHTVPRLDEAQTATVIQFFNTQLAAIDATEVVSSKNEGEGPDVATSVKFDAIDPVDHSSKPLDSHNDEICVSA
jgi:pimeloyl-ACP methyl ester carboxylesterase